MGLKILNEKDFRKSRWSGGVTTEMFIFPPYASYAKRDFLFRISSASVDEEQTEFTPLSGITRLITPLSSGFVLTHLNEGGEKTVRLGPRQIHRFDGGARTLCRGAGNDLNLMLKGCSGEMVYAPGCRIKFEGDFLFVYALEDMATENGEKASLKKGGLAFTREKGVYAVGESIVMTIKLRENLVDNGARNIYNIKMMNCFTKQISSPVGVLSITEHGGAITEIFFGAKPQNGGSELLGEAEKQIGEYFAGKRKAFDLPFFQQGGDFCNAVWERMAKIPYGETVTYGQLADFVGKHGAARAVGRACNKNSLPLIVPCHRVVGKNGLTGFAAGLEVKKFLLELEQKYK